MSRSRSRAARLGPLRSPRLSHRGEAVTARLSYGQVSGSQLPGHSMQSQPPSSHAVQYWGHALGSHSPKSHPVQNWGHSLTSHSPRSHAVQFCGQLAGSHTPQSSQGSQFSGQLVQSHSCHGALQQSPQSSGHDEQFSSSSHTALPQPSQVEASIRHTPLIQLSEPPVRPGRYCWQVGTTNAVRSHSSSPLITPSPQRPPQFSVENRHDTGLHSRPPPVTLG